MNRITFAALFVLSAAILCSAQTQPAPIEWRFLSSEEDRFSVEVPVGLNYSRDEYLGKFVQGRGEVALEGTYLYIFVDNPGTGTQYHTVEEWAKANRQSPKLTSMDGREALTFEFEGSDGYFHKIIRAKSDSRIFSFHTVSRKKDDEFTDRFLESIRFSIRETEVTPRGSSLITATDAASEPPKAGGQNANSAAAGDPASTTPPQVRPVPKGESKPLRIISKQKAQYTDFARFYNISGHVTLRVTFGSDSKIGSVSVIKGLPFGLTQSAVNAVRQMGFEPEVFDGAPRTTTRPVSFQFTIY